MQMYRVLLVEDENLISEMYQRALRNVGLDVSIANDGSVALDMIREEAGAFDLILLDIMMPTLNGIGVLKELKAHDSPYKDIPVVMLTNLGQDDILRQSLSIGANKYMIKSSLLPGQLAEKVKKYLEEWNA